MQTEAKQAFHMNGFTTTFFPAPPCEPVLQDNQPEGDLLYHYTTLNTLAEFLKRDQAGNATGDLYATHFLALNDSAEFRLGFQDGLAKLKNVGVIDAEGKKRLAKLMDHEAGGTGLAPWITSFSRERDSLYQWVAYTDRKEGGVAVGFKKKDLDCFSRNATAGVFAEILLHRCGATPNPTEPVSHLADCLYHETPEYLAELNQVPQIALNEKLRKLDNCLETSTLAALFVFASLVKNPSFSQERETRLVMVSPVRKGDPRFAFLGGKPRLKTNFFHKDRPLADSIGEIVISPHGDRDRLVSSVRLLKSVSGATFDIRVSASSYNGR